MRCACAMRMAMPVPPVTAPSRVQHADGGGASVPCWMEGRGDREVGGGAFAGEGDPVGAGVPAVSASRQEERPLVGRRPVRECAVRACRAAAVEVPAVPGEPCRHDGHSFEHSTRRGARPDAGVGDCQLGAFRPRRYGCAGPRSHRGTRGFCGASARRWARRFPRLARRLSTSTKMAKHSGVTSPPQSGTTSWAAIRYSRMVVPPRACRFRPRAARPRNPTFHGHPPTDRGDPSARSAAVTETRRKLQNLGAGSRPICFSGGNTGCQKS